MQEIKRLAIHVVAWNRREALACLFASLEAQTFRDFQVIVIDQASTDGLSTWSQTAYPDAVTLRNFRNQGYARAYNQAIALTLSRWSGEDLGHRYLAFVRPDAVFEPETFGRLVAALDADPALSFVGPCIFQAKIQIAEDGDLWQIIPTDQKESCGMRLSYGGQFVHLANMPQQGDVFAPSPACFLLRASVLPALAIDGQWFDEQLFPGQEIEDLFWRAQWAGFRVRMVQEARASHPSGVLLSTQENLCARHLRGLLCLKNDRWFLRLLHAPWILADRLISLFFCMAHPSVAIAWFRSLPVYFLMYRRRKMVLAQSKISWKDMWRRLRAFQVG